MRTVPSQNPHTVKWAGQELNSAVSEHAYTSRVAQTPVRRRSPQFSRDPSRRYRDGHHTDGVTSRALLRAGQRLHTTALRGSCVGCRPVVWAFSLPNSTPVVWPGRVGSISRQQTDTWVFSLGASREQLLLTSVCTQVFNLGAYTFLLL